LIFIFLFGFFCRLLITFLFCVARSTEVTDEPESRSPAQSARHAAFRDAGAPF